MRLTRLVQLLCPCCPFGSHAPAARPSGEAAPTPPQEAGPTSASPVQVDVYLPSASPWQADDGSWRAAPHLSVHNRGNSTLAAGWELSVAVAEATTVQESWGWQPQLGGGRLTGRAEEDYRAIDAGAKVEVGAVLGLKAGHIRLSDATINSQPCALAGDLQRDRSSVGDNGQEGGRQGSP